MATVGEWVQPPDQWVEQPTVKSYRTTGHFRYGSAEQFASQVNTPRGWLDSSANDFAFSRVLAPTTLDDLPNWGQSMGALYATCPEDPSSFPQIGPEYPVSSNDVVEFEADAGEYLEDEWQVLLVLWSRAAQGTGGQPHGNAFGSLRRSPTNTYPGRSDLSLGTPTLTAALGGSAQAEVGITPGERVAWYCLTEAQRSQIAPPIDGPNAAWAQSAQVTMLIQAWYHPPRYRIIRTAGGQHSLRQFQLPQGNRGGHPLRQFQRAGSTGGHPLRQFQRGS